MKIWFDTEFTDGGNIPKLISIGAVSEDHREFYAISTDFDRRTASPWVRDNVLPLLDSPDAPSWKSNSTIASEFVAFVGPDPVEFWSLIATTDWYLLTQLLGGFDNLPKNWPFECLDLHQWAYHLGADSIYPKLRRQFGSGREHHALNDAREHRAIYEYLLRIAETR